MVKGSADRIVTLDAIRGAAVLGILLMNIVGFGLPEAYEDPTVSGGATGANLYVWRINTLLFEGSLRGLFTVLFGAGAILYIERNAGRHAHIPPSQLYLRRMGWLVAFGFLNGYALLWPGDVLYFYGIAGLALYLFREVSPRLLIPLALGILSLQTVALALDRVHYLDLREAAMTGEPAAVENFQATYELWKPPPEKIAARVAAMQSGYADAFAVTSRESSWAQSGYFVRYALAECLGTMLLGMALLKLGVLTGRLSTRRYLALLIAGYAIGIAVNLREIFIIERGGFAPEALLESALTYDLGRIPLTLGHIALLALFVRTRAFARVTAALADVGRMALTNYLAQSLMAMLVFTGVGLALYGELERYQLYYVVLAMWVAQIAWSRWWLRRHAYGPFEWLWRSLTLGAPQPWRQR